MNSSNFNKGRRSFLKLFGIGASAAAVGVLAIDTPAVAKAVPKKPAIPGLAGDFDGDVDNPLNFGSISWKPEVTRTIPVMTLRNPVIPPHRTCVMKVTRLEPPVPPRNRSVSSAFRRRGI